MEQLKESNHTSKKKQHRPASPKPCVICGNWFELNDVTIDLCMKCNEMFEEESQFDNKA